VTLSSGFFSRFTLTAALLGSLTFTALPAQESAPHPPDYRGVSTHIPGVFVTPVPGAPFSGTVEIYSKELLPDGSAYERHTINHIARNTAGVIYNERRRLVPLDHEGEPRLLSFHIYDPQTHLNTFLDPSTHLARQALRSEPEHPPANTTPGTTVTVPNAQNVTTEELGTDTFAGLTLRGTRKLRTIPASLSGTGKEVTITDEYWYSEDLKVYLVVKHDDPRTGEQTVGITAVDRHEPNPSLFQIPAGYKIVDETPVDVTQH
jgi:hypothetical protein